MFWICSSVGQVLGLETSYDHIFSKLLTSLSRVATAVTGLPLAWEALFPMRWQLGHLCRGLRVPTVNRQWTVDETRERHLQKPLGKCNGCVQVHKSLGKNSVISRAHWTTHLPLSEVWPQVHIELPAVWPRRTTCGNGQANLLIHCPSCALFVLLHVPHHTIIIAFQVFFCANPNLSVA